MTLCETTPGFKDAVAGFLFPAHTVPDQLIHGNSTTRDPWRVRLQQDVEATVERAAGFLAGLGLQEQDLMEATPSSARIERMAEWLQEGVL